MSSSFNIQSKTKVFDVRVSTMDADLEFKVDTQISGRDLFDLVCRTLGLREIWYFGLQYTNSKGYACWLQLNKTVLKQDVLRKNDSVQFVFVVKFYPEVVDEELIQDSTIHLFFLQVKQAVLSMEIYCPAEASVLLATYAVQAQYGDMDEQPEPIKLHLEDLLPRKVIDQYQMTNEMWQDRIKTWWANNRGLTREEAEMEYLKISQDLDMTGVHYFDIRNKKESDLFLGVAAHGVNIYSINKLTPTTMFKWSEIKNISFKDKRFIIKTMSGDSTTFYSRDMAVNQTILDLCIGTHNLYLKRRQTDSLEIQQMKSQAKEDRERRKAEQLRFEREKRLRADVEQERDRLKERLSQLEDQLKLQEAALKRTEETADLLAQKAHISEQQALCLAKRASEADAQLQRVRINQIKTEEEKIQMERKAREAELIASRTLEEADRRQAEADKLKHDLFCARQSERDAKQCLSDVTGVAAADSLRGLVGGVNHFTTDSLQSYYASPSAHGRRLSVENGGRVVSSEIRIHPPPDPTNVDGVAHSTLLNRIANGAAVPPPPSVPSIGAPPDLRSLSEEIDKERREYMQKSHHLQEQLLEMRSEIDGMKLEDRRTEEDRIHDDSLQQGETKYSTLRKSGAGSTRARIELFDGL